MEKYEDKIYSLGEAVTGQTQAMSQAVQKTLENNGGALYKAVHFSLYRLLQGSVLPLFREAAKNGLAPVYLPRHKRSFSMSLLSVP